MRDLAHRLDRLFNHPIWKQTWVRVLVGIGGGFCTGTATRYLDLAGVDVATIAVGLALALFAPYEVRREWRARHRGFVTDRDLRFASVAVEAAGVAVMLQGVEALVRYSFRDPLAAEWWQLSAYAAFFACVVALALGVAFTLAPELRQRWRR